MDFSVHASRLSAEADARLGDLIQYAPNGANGGDYVDIRGRILAVEPAAGWNKINEARSTWRLHVSMDQLGGRKPSMDDRVKCAAILGDGIYRPMAKDPVRDGRYYLVDLQRAA